MSTKTSLPRLVVLASGEGTNFEAIVRASRSGQLAAQVVGLIASQKNLGVTARAQKLAIEHCVLNISDFSKRELWDQALCDKLSQWQADWVILAGFLKLIGPLTLRKFNRRIVNTHPSLLPAYGGRGLYGLKVHEAVLQAKEKVTGLTVHLIDEEYDRGQILAQKQVAIDPRETVESLAARLKILENEFFPRVLNDLVSGQITIS